MRLAPVAGTRLTEDQRAFEADVREFLSGAEVRGAVERIRRCPPEAEPGLLDIYRWLGARGWLAPSWPREYGGLGLGAAESAIVTEQMCLAGVPDDAHVLSIDIVGTFILHIGTDRQRQRLLPPLARGESIATVLFTEPGCGSDLSRLRTTAEPAGEAWRLQGTKVYNQKTQFGDMALCAARTSEHQVPWAGITLFLLPLVSPGVTITPIENLTNDRFHEVTIDGVELGPDDVLGPVGDGWQLLNEMLVLERTGIDFHAKLRRWLDSVAAEGSEAGWAEEFAELDARLAAARALAWRVIAGLGAGTPDPALAAMSKWYASEQAAGVARFGLQTRGLAGALSAWDPEAPDLGLVEAACRYAPTHRLGSGTSEVMLYIVASTRLGLL
ncbi:MAG TPA: acyl-CoA dehydrogenase family protein [Streptosporangiaceae bacterium]|jgi:alkylation response protein AidB-like acyl-CoA dehydrogenase|nr:acyl-CoA dehydrogenase family protein [Streptosporangiaceae bacterium]